MELIKSVIHLLAFGSLGFSAAAAYLKINKIWSRKHQREVAESISIVGNLVDVLPLSIFALNYLFVCQWQGLIDSCIWIMAGAVSIWIGSGFWVREKRKGGIWSMVKQALNIERKEAFNLARALFQCSNPNLIIDILKQIAFIDQHLDEKEKEYIQSFSDLWGIEIDWDQFVTSTKEEKTNYCKLSQAINRYLKTSPSPEQVIQLIDIINTLITIDNIVTSEEKILMDESKKLFESYLKGGVHKPYYCVVIIPQKAHQEEIISSVLRDVPKQKIAGGDCYVVGSFFSEDYASVVCEQYRAKNLFALVTTSKNITGDVSYRSLHFDRPIKSRNLEERLA